MRQRTGIIETDITFEDFVMTIIDNISRASIRVDWEQKTNCQTRIVKFFPLKIITITEARRLLSKCVSCDGWKVKGKGE